MSYMKRKTVIAINKLNPSAAQSIVRLVPDACVVVLRDEQVAPQNRTAEIFQALDIQELETNYFDKERLASDVDQFRDDLVGVISRGEASMQYLARLSDACLDWGLPLPSSKSLAIASDKKLMRRAFLEGCPELTPRFLEITQVNNAVLHDIKDQLGYPIIIKPANLASSLLIQRCNTPEELTRALTKTLQEVSDIYRESGRHETPAVIVEQMLDGALYSVDAYISQSGDIWYCPPVSYVTGHTIGVDDFFLYRRNAPAHLPLDGNDWLSCQHAIRRGVKAMGLRATTVHVELCLTEEGWKIIEIGARPGRYRIEMYRYAYGIEHSDNDIRVRLGLEPVINDDIVAYCASYSVYPATEGILENISGFDRLQGLRSLMYLRRIVASGETVRYAKNGGRAIAEVILAHENPSQFRRDAEWFEKDVKAIVK